MFAEDLSLFFTDMGVDATLSGVAVRGMFDESTVEVFGGEAQTLAPTYMLATTSVASRAPGQAFVVPAGGLPAQLAHVAGNYQVREVRFDPLDGALTRLILVRT